MRPLFREVESSELSTEFYLYCSSIEWLVRWFERQPALKSLASLIAADESAVKKVAKRALKLASSAADPGRRIREEPALCCYAFVLATAASPIAAEAVEELYSVARPDHGWLKRIIDWIKNKSPAAGWSGDLPLESSTLAFYKSTSVSDSPERHLPGSTPGSVVEIDD